MKIHEIRIADPMFWEGPDGTNRILAEGLGVVYGSPAFMISKESYLVQVLHPFLVAGVTLFPVTEWPAHVYVFRILDESLLKEATFQPDQVEMIAWGIIFRSPSEFSGCNDT